MKTQLRTLKIKAFVLLLSLSSISVSSAWQNEQDYEPDGAYASNGFLEAFKDIDVAAPEMGIVDGVHVRLGQSVTADQLLVNLESSVLEASVNMAKSKANAKARLLAAEIEYRNLERRYEKVTELLENGAARPEEVEKARANADVAMHNISAIREENEVFSWEVKELEARIEQRNIRSPIDGVVIEIFKKRGEHVSQNDPLIARVVNLEKLRAIFHLPTQVAMQTQVNQQLTVYMKETDQTATAVVEYVAPITSADSGRVRVEVLIDNSDGRYQSGVRCEIKDRRVSRAVPTPINSNR